MEIPRKNGKSTLAAAIALYILFADSERGAEVYSCAGDRAQASIIFNIAKSMVENSHELTKRAQVYRDTTHTQFSLMNFTRNRIVNFGIQ